MNALADLPVATPERVQLELPVAGLGHRTLAYLVDVTLLFFFWVSVYFVYSLIQRDLLDFFLGLGGWGRTFAILGTFATQWLYWSACEVAFRGQTAGKRLLRIRVVRGDGSPVTFFESAIRNLCRALDFLPALYATGLTFMLFTRNHSRLGDLVAGTVVVREERIDLGRYALSDGASAGAIRLGAQETELVLEFLSRAPSLDDAARLRVGGALLRRFAPSEAPPERIEALEARLRKLTQPEGP